MSAGSRGASAFPPEAAASLEEGRSWLRQHLAARRNPFGTIDEQAASRTIDRLTGLDPESWVEAWCGEADRFAAVARRALDAADADAARAAWFQAYAFSALGRYPSPVHPAKLAAYDRAREYFARATALEDPAVERVAVPFDARPGEGASVVFHVARPKGAVRPPVVLMWGGIDAWKEETWARGKPFRERGIATVHLDMPGVGESPLLAGVDAERQWDPIFDWLAGSDLDAGRCAALGLSFGGYWSMKLAHTHRDRLVAAVNWGGGVHRTFQRQWQERSRNASSYLMDLMAARARIFGGATFEDYVARCPELSLLDQGVLDRPSAPLLLVNGIDDQQNDAEDIHLSLRHGDPKTARIFPGGHMGEGPVLQTVLDWLTDRLRAEAATHRGDHR